MRPASVGWSDRTATVMGEHHKGTKPYRTSGGHLSAKYSWIKSPCAGRDMRWR
ncbi:hypothetical protein KCP69_15725 [Salmonella enterica subsp. enterica]|nr:hypothetical protein KCP69_15725 [Salmonella enterica subsp. enterica]